MPKKGYKQSPEAIKNRVESFKRSGRTSSEGHWGWKGESVGYSALHIWVRNHYGSPSRCEHADETCSEKFEWASKNNEYTRDRTAWLQLCGSHHRRYDGVVRKLSDADIRRIREDHKLGLASHRVLAQKYGVSNMTIYNILKGKRWSHVK